MWMKTGYQNLHTCCTVHRLPFTDEMMQLHVIVESLMFQMKRCLIKGSDSDDELSVI